MTYCKSLILAATCLLTCPLFVQAYIGPPNIGARFDILRSSILELCRVGIVQGTCGPLDLNILLAWMFKSFCI